MNHLINSTTRAPVKVGDTLVTAEGQEYKITRLPTFPYAQPTGPSLFHVGYLNEAGEYREIEWGKIGLELAYPHRHTLYDGGKVEYKGLEFTVRFPYDDDSTPPWGRGDGYGIVSAWTSRDKRPGERVIAQDGYRKRYYDWAGSIKKAKVEGWDAAPYGTGTKGERAARAVQADFEFLQGWCDDEWNFVDIVISCAGEADACRGYETYKDCHMEGAWEMIESMADDILEKRAAAQTEQDELQVVARQLWEELSSYYGGSIDPEEDRAEARTHYNRILVKAGLQPIAG